MVLLRYAADFTEYAAEPVFLRAYGTALYREGQFVEAVQRLSAALALEKEAVRK